MQSTNAQLQSVHLNLPADSLEAIASRPKVPQDLYAPVDEYQTRILTILPGDLHTELLCELKVVDLIHAEGVIIHGTNERLHYQALSYSWGYQPSIVRLVCNRQECHISASLEQALQTLRSNDRATHIWVDAYCINQADLAEKSRQIRNIRLIFHKAEKVGIWLGHDANALQIKNELFWLESLEGQFFYDLSSTSAILGPLFDSCRWFRRCWVSSFEHVCLGAQILAERPFVDPKYDKSFQVHDVLSRIGSTNPYVPLLHMIISRLTAPGLRISSRLDVYLLAKSCVAFQATKPRDKVYGLLGLLPEPESGWAPAHRPGTPLTRAAGIPVDYTRSVAEVYRDMTVHVLLSAGHLGILELHTPTETDPYHLPSWVFNFETPSDQMLDQIHKTSESVKMEHTLAGANKAFVDHYQARDGLNDVDAGAPVLIVRGSMLSRIETIARFDGTTPWRSATLEHTTFAANLYMFNSLAEAGDIVVYLFKGVLPFVLRPISTFGNEHYLSHHPVSRLPFLARSKTGFPHFYKFLGAAFAPLGLLGQPDMRQADKDKRLIIQSKRFEHSDLQSFHLV